MSATSADIASFYNNTQAKDVVRPTINFKVVLFVSFLSLLIVIFGVTTYYYFSRSLKNNPTNDVGVYSLDLPVASSTANTDRESSLSAEAIQAMKDALQGNFHDDISQVSKHEEGIEDLPKVSAFEIEGQISEGYSWATSMAIDDPGLCDQFMESHGSDFVDGCKSGVTSTEIKSNNRTPAPRPTTPVPTPTPIRVSPPITTQTPTPIPIPKPIINIEQDYNVCVSNIISNPFESETTRKAKEDQCAHDIGNQQGCCSSHGGVDSCSGVNVVCNDGVYSPTCKC